MLLGMALAGLLALPAGAAEKAESKKLSVELVNGEITMAEGIVFAQGAGRGVSTYTLAMDVLQPRSGKPLPLIVFVTGGGFIMAPRTNWIQQRMELAGNGYVVASVEYRVAPNGRFPQPLEDVKSAIRWLRAHASRFNIDPERVGVLGNSAGGYLSAFTGVTSGSTEFDKGEYLDQSSSVLCAADIYGLSDLTLIGADYSEKVQEEHRSAGATEALWVLGTPTFGGKDGGINAHPEDAAKANPINYITEKSAPMLLMHGTADTLVSPSQTDLLFQALRAKGIESERYVVEGATHGGPHWVQEPVMKIIVDFFDKHLKK
ncbi:MAG: alpha/beta hydrolase [Fretibacterium sp.]|nr:alpha/beta hydrolase [Fretibacterium sp.]